MDERVFHERFSHHFNDKLIIYTSSYKKKMTNFSVTAYFQNAFIEILAALYCL